MRTLAILAISIGFLSFAQAQTLKERKIAEGITKDLTESEHGEAFQKKCGYALPTTFDPKMVAPFEAESASLSSYCDGPRRYLADMCDDGTNKAAISAKIKKVSCKLGKKGEQALKLLKNGELEYTVGVHAPNQSEFVRDWADNNL